MTNMNYELAKQLKDAGFPQIKNLRTFPPGCSHWGTKDHPVGDISCECWISDPTLEELIEACGDNFEFLVKRSPTMNPFWEAYMRNGESLCGGGQTPIEAVAHLWLALNQKL